LIRPLRTGFRRIRSISKSVLAGRGTSSGVRDALGDALPAGAMLDERQDMQSVQQDGIDVRATGCDDSGGVGCRN
jgi:hypothetical protein